ncbi:MAG: Asp-tRNA(Asn)/Glu-tRNA(Gln) amidotransferase GatCAB subunit C, partial [Clostridia bacterium]|nr:Asp-tRNA(Asn)/Glu-tRNA(Gln) amidotransferase GatCAB subunit C [Clostridia bacterium]
MAELINGYKRTKLCGEFRNSDIGNEIVCMGFVGKYRNLGNLIFIDVRDRAGIVQVSFDDSTPKDIFEKATKLRNEYVVCIKGIVRSRGSNINKNLPTGDIEIIANDLKILNEAEVTPFVISDDAKVGDVTRLKYRYLDLRRPSLQKILMMRSK